MSQPAQGPSFSEGCHASTCPGIQTPGGCHASACWGSARDLGMSSSQVATVLGRICFRETHSLRKSTHKNRRKPISCGTVPGLSDNSGAQ